VDDIGKVKKYLFNEGVRLSKNCDDGYIIHTCFIMRRTIFIILYYVPTQRLRADLYFSTMLCSERDFDGQLKSEVDIQIHTSPRGLKCHQYRLYDIIV